MPFFEKKVMSQFINTECKRQLRLYLFPDNKRFAAEREAQGLPPVQPPRPGLHEIREAGEEWHEKVLGDLVDIFGPDAIVGDAQIQPSGRIRYGKIALADVLAAAAPERFLAEAQFEIGPSFENALGIADYRSPSRFSLEYAAARPDLIEVLPPGSGGRYLTPAGEVVSLPAVDGRLQLRVIEIKLSSEPNPGYFAEAAYYSMALAGWIIDKGLDGRFVVVPEMAIWPGTHETSALRKRFAEIETGGRTPTFGQLTEAMKDDLEEVPFEVFAFRIRRFFQDEIPEVLGAASWRDLGWHVDNRCKGCEYLGYPWVDRNKRLTADEDHCMPTAERENRLSRIAFISRGASLALQQGGVTDVPTLAGTSADDEVFDSHHTLRATRTVIPGRAEALQTAQARIPSGTGTAAVMPRWADLRIHLSVDFDLGSAITFALGIKAFCLEHRAFGSTNPAPRARRTWDKVYIVDGRNTQAEQRELLSFLKQINVILGEARQLHPRTTVQFYLWDTLQYKHLTRVMGRHLPAILNDDDVWRLAWLFPAEETLPNPDMSSRESPVTIVRDVVKALVAAPVPHYYSLLATARVYHHSELPEGVAQFKVHPLFEDMLSDQIPSERAHEIWTRSASPRRQWLEQVQTTIETVKKKLGALETVVRRLEEDLGGNLANIAPEINVGPPTRPSRMSFDGQLWLQFARLNEALARLEVHQVRAMPPNEREARFRSARLTRRLTGAEEATALARLGLAARVGRRVYAMNNGSREVKLKEGDFNVALAPEDQGGFLDRTFANVTDGTSLSTTPGINPFRTRMEDVTGVTVVALDRDNSVIVLDPNQRFPAMLDDLEANSLADFSADVVLDPVHHDFFTKKLRESLAAIGNPRIASDNALVRRAVGLITARGAHVTPTTPAAEVLWNAPSMHTARVTRMLPPARAAVERRVGLNPSQWTAWEEALSRRLALVWGPPGTGKSRTARAVVDSAVLEAHQQGRLIRVLISASTYNGLDNVLLKVHDDLKALLPDGSYAFHRLRSYMQQPDAAVPAEIDVEVNKYAPSAELTALQGRLAGGEGTTVVGATPEQTYNLLAAGDSANVREFFDMILIDEASQMDVGHAVLVLCSLAIGGCVVLAGDPLQLPPIHQAVPPAGLEGTVGSVYGFCREVHAVPEVMLEENYRSNTTLVEFSLNAGYERTLRSYSPDLRLNLLSPLPTARPADWPSSLYWTPEWSALLDPGLPAACFVYPEGRSSQWNRFEADAVAAMIRLLNGRMADGLRGERDPVTGVVKEVSKALYAPRNFWDEAVGVVTPHRAQQGLIVSRLQSLFTGSGVPSSVIRGAVDTVERFQGQQRDVIIASFALGDPDAIQDEDEFLLSLNRFNVMASRARAKLVVLVSQQVVDHLSGDLDTLRGSYLLKSFVESFCGNPREMVLGVRENGEARRVRGLFKSRGW